jgi:hypothetical protein
MTEACPYCAGLITIAEAIPTCSTHPEIRMICPSCVGGKGGRTTSDQKQRAVQWNGKQGGRPRIHPRRRRRIPSRTRQDASESTQTRQDDSGVGPGLQTPQNVSQDVLDPEVHTAPTRPLDGDG